MEYHGVFEFLVLEIIAKVCIKCFWQVYLLHATNQKVSCNRKLPCKGTIYRYLHYNLLILNTDFSDCCNPQS